MSLRNNRRSRNRLFGPAASYARYRRSDMARPRRNGYICCLRRTLLVFSREFQVAAPEDLIITKAVAHRKRDLLDIDNLVSVYPNLDLARIRHWVGQFAAVLESPELVGDLENILENRH